MEGGSGVGVCTNSDGVDGTMGPSEPLYDESVIETESNIDNNHMASLAPLVIPPLSHDDEIGTPANLHQLLNLHHGHMNNSYSSPISPDVHMNDHNPHHPHVHVTSHAQQPSRGSHKGPAKVSLSPSTEDVKRQVVKAFEEVFQVELEMQPDEKGLKQMKGRFIGCYGAYG